MREAAVNELNVLWVLADALMFVRSMPEAVALGLRWISFCGS